MTSLASPPRILINSRRDVKWSGGPPRRTGWYHSCGWIEKDPPGLAPLLNADTLCSAVDLRQRCRERVRDACSGIAEYGRGHAAPVLESADKVRRVAEPGRGGDLRHRLFGVAQQE